MPRKITRKSSLSIPVLFLLFPVLVIADEMDVRQSAEEKSQAAEDELMQLEQTIGEKADETAGDLQNKSTSDEESSSKPWLPAAKEFDWVQLTSGEWLKGEIKSMYNESLEFDSDKLDLLTIDWEDVKYLKSYRPSNVNIENYEPITGSLQVSDDKVTISGSDKMQEFARSELISLTPYGDMEIDLWTVKLSVGLNYRRGNTDESDYTAKFNAKRRLAKTRFELDYTGNISETENDDGELNQTINNHRVKTNYIIYSTRYFFYQPVFAEYYRDPFKNIDQTITLGAGLGYTIFDTGKYEWNVQGGPGYLSTKYISVLPGEEQKIDDAALVLSTDFEAEITDTLDFTYNYDIKMASTDAGGYTHNMVATIESEITGRLDLNISLSWDRISQPTKDDSGVEPEPDDYLMTVGITYTY
jgi:putative salt-induced outer membrane protein YdiY